MCYLIKVKVNMHVAIYNQSAVEVIVLIDYIVKICV